MKPSRAEAGEAWRALIADARAYAKRVVSGEELSREESVLFLGRVVRVTKMPFPLDHASATCAVDVFGKAARGFMTAARDEERQVLGGIMSEAARGLDRLLVVDAERWRRMAGEVD